MGLCKFLMAAMRPLPRFRFTTIVLALSAPVLACAGCATGERRSGTAPEVEGHPMHEAGERPLAGDALRQLLRNVYVTPVQPGGVIVSHPPGEAFKSDGMYIRVPNRTRQFGTFDIEADRVCVSGPDFPSLCREVTDHQNGTYSFTDRANGTVSLVTITPLVFGSAGTREPPIEISGTLSSAARVDMPKPYEPPAGFTLVRDNELRDLIIGSTVEPAHWTTNARPVQLKERYLPNGKFRAINSRFVEYKGTYYITKGSVCALEARFTNYCFGLLHDNQGRYFRYFIGFDIAPEPVLIRRIKGRGLRQ